MSLAKKPARGALVEQLAGASRTLALGLGEIERFEDMHRGIFDLWDGFYSGGTKPTAKEVRDLVALALVGGGLSDLEADAILEDLKAPEHLQRLYKIAQGVIGVAFLPDMLSQTKKPVKKKTSQAAS